MIIKEKIEKRYLKNMEIISHYIQFPTKCNKGKIESMFNEILNSYSMKLEDIEYKFTLKDIVLDYIDESTKVAKEIIFIFIDKNIEDCKLEICFNSYKCDRKETNVNTIFGYAIETNLIHIMEYADIKELADLVDSDDYIKEKNPFFELDENITNLIKDKSVKCTSDIPYMTLDKEQLYVKNKLFILENNECIQIINKIVTFYVKSYFLCNCIIEVSVIDDNYKITVFVEQKIVCNTKMIQKIKCFTLFLLSIIDLENIIFKEKINDI